MAMDLLRQLAGSRLPATFAAPDEIDKVKLLRAAGLVIALTPVASCAPTNSGSANAAQVLAITDRGRDELARFTPPGNAPLLRSARTSWWTARRVADYFRRAP